MPNKDKKSIREKHEDISKCFTKYCNQDYLEYEAGYLLSLKVDNIPKSLKESLSKELVGEFYPDGNCFYLLEKERESHRQDAEKWLSKSRQEVRDYVVEKIPDFEKKVGDLWKDEPLVNYAQEYNTDVGYGLEYALMERMNADMQKKQEEYIKEYCEKIEKIKSEKQNTNDKSSETELEREAREYGETHIIGFPYQKDKYKERKLHIINDKHRRIKQREAIVKQWEREAAKERRNSTKKNINKSGTNKDNTNVTEIVGLLLDASNKSEKKAENAKKLFDIIFGDNLKSSLLKGKKDLFVKNIMETAQATRVAFTKFEKNMKKLGKNIMQNNAAVKQLVRDFVTKVRQRWNQCIKDIKVGLEATQGKWTKHIRNQDENSKGLHRS